MWYTSKSWVPERTIKTCTVLVGVESSIKGTTRGSRVYPGW